MDNSYFICTKKDVQINIERFHLCTWEFKDNSSLVEFGCEIANPKNKEIENISLGFHIPWLTPKCKVNDLYDKLKESDNCRFIFNDSVKGNKFLDDGQKKDGVVQEFLSRTSLCILPIKSTIIPVKKTIDIEIDLKSFNNCNIPENTNIYFRFYLEPSIRFISTRKTGISRSTIIYDVKVNEKRNLPDSSILDLREKVFCNISKCFFLNIIPNNYDLTFFDAGSLKNIRTLEYGSFKKYLGDKRVKKDELVVIFNKKEQKESYSFFSVFSKERIGAGQFALAVLINLLTGILLFIPSYRAVNKYDIISINFWISLPIEAYIAISIGLLLLIYFIWPKIINFFKVIFKRIISIFRKKK